MLSLMFLIIAAGLILTSLVVDGEAMPRLSVMAAGLLYVGTSYVVSGL